MRGTLLKIVVVLKLVFFEVIPPVSLKEPAGTWEARTSMWKARELHPPITHLFPCPCAPSQGVHTHSQQAGDNPDHLL